MNLKETVGTSKGRPFSARSAVIPKKGPIPLAVCCSSSKKRLHEEAEHGR